MNLLKHGQNCDILSALTNAYLSDLFFSGLYAGIKFFLIDFIFKRCPRLRAKYDTPYIIWTSLPTDPQLKERSNATVSRRVRIINHFVPLSPASSNQIPFSLPLFPSG